MAGCDFLPFTDTRCLRLRLASRVSDPLLLFGGTALACAAKCLATRRKSCSGSASTHTPHLPDDAKLSSGEIQFQKQTSLLIKGILNKDASLGMRSGVRFVKFISMIPFSLTKISIVLLASLLDISATGESFYKSSLF